MANADVVIVGAGPVGLGLAIDLALRGVRSVVLERGTGLHRIPKGQNLTQRTGEHFRAWGVTEAIQAATPIPRSSGNAGLVAYGKLLSDYTYDWFQRAKVGAYYFALNERLPQYETEAVLRARAADLPQIDFRTGHDVTRLTVGADSAEVKVQAGNASQTLTARYVVGCDGARSRIRDMAGIAQETDHEGPRMALLVFRSTELDGLLARFPGKSIYNVMNPDLDGYWQFLGRVDLNGGWFYHAPVPDDASGEAYFRDHLHRMVGAPFALEFDHIGFWDLRISHAKTYRNGPVFIAGDAAHSHPPYGGYGVNTGFEDARNLAWKLAASLEGWAGADLLDSYSAERHPVFRSVAQDFIGRMIADFRTFMARHAPERDKSAFEAAWHARTQADDSDVTEYLPNYAGSPIVFGTPGAVSGAKGVHRVAAASGHHLAPQPLPGDRDMWATLGPGFTLFDFGDPSHWAGEFRTAATALSVPLEVVPAPDPALRAAYETEAMLVRPDQFIAWTASGPGDDAKAGDILGRAIGSTTKGGKDVS